MPWPWDNNPPFGGFDPNAANDPIAPYLGAYGSRALTGPPRGSPAGGLPVQARDASPFALTRERTQRELEDNPELRRALDANTTAEVGTDPQKRRWYQALTLDRAVQTGQPLANIVNNPNYYPASTTGATATTGMGVDPSLWAGANPANYATGNASLDPRTGRWVGFAGGPQTSTFGTGRGMELGGIEGQGGLPYARAMGYAGPATTPIGPAGPQGANDAVALAGAPSTGVSTVARGRRTMPESLMDLFSSGFQPRDIGNPQQPLGFGDALQQRSNSLIGLGLGLISPTRFGQGTQWSNALQGYMQGAQADTANARQARQEAFQRSQAAQAQQNFERTFARGDITDAQRAMKDVLGPNASPEAKADFMRKYYEPKTEGDWSVVQVPHPTYPGETIPMWANKRTREMMPFPNTPTGAPGGNAFAGAVNPLAPGAAGQAAPAATGGGVSYGQAAMGGQGFGTGGVTPAYPGGTAQAAPAAGSIPPAPPGSDPKEWRKEQTKMLVKQAGAQESAKQSANLVLGNLDRAINIVQNVPGRTTGVTGQLLSHVGGTEAGNLAGLLNTVKANVSFDKLNQMRRESPTGGALGNVSDKEQKLLQGAIGDLEQARDPGQVLYNLAEVRRVYHDIIHGPGTAPPNPFPLPATQRAPTAPGARTGGAGVPTEQNWIRDSNGRLVPQ